MPGLSAVVFIPDDTAKTGYSRPMMLQNIMGTPLLSWLASSLIAGGVGRFFMVCHERFRRDVRACIPDDVGFFCPAQEAVSDQLHVFLQRNAIGQALTNCAVAGNTDSNLSHNVLLADLQLCFRFGAVKFVRR